MPLVVVEVQGRVRAFGATRALDDLEPRRSEVLGVLRPDGAGRTTLLSVAALGRPS